MKTKLLILIFFPLVFLSQSFSKQRIEFLTKQLKGENIDARFGEEKAISICNELYMLSKEENDKSGMLIAITYRSRAYITRMDTNACLKSVEEGLPIAEELKSYKDWVSLLLYKAKSLMLVKDFDNARSCFSKAFKIVNLIDDKNTMHKEKYYIYENLALYSIPLFKDYNKRSYKDSILYFALKSYSEISKVPDPCPQKGQSLQNIAFAYDTQGNYKEADKYYDYAEKRQIKENDKRYIANVYALR
ncbi:hypothetical protein [Chryseobacterium shigense]|uniref:Tetratricopeptide (TPR) repeat protein n=1 Tax=Chryseobacterium shigense TaxID=297244 RepID=A0A841N7P3_9FLAO|nr:hypothetical protein [Chryseobacterium shigense]MBB6372617.1 tetratricopeptide (TPR) repeat protein [Chryseobacterium shigense]